MLGLASGLAACSDQPSAANPEETGIAGRNPSVITREVAGTPATDGGAPDGQPPPCVVGCARVPQLFDRPLTLAESAPPPVSGGTLLATRDAKWLVAADPDRDRIYFVDAQARSLSHVRQLQPGDEPGRLIEDAAGRIHVALRSGHVLVSLGREPDSPITRRAICDLPRGLAYDPAQDAVHVACAEGTLVTVPAEPSGEITRTLELGRDLRDVIVRGAELLVTRFRSAELLRVSATTAGSLQESYRPPTVSARVDASGASDPGPLDTENTPTTAWRAIDIPTKGTALLHQRARVGSTATSPGAYGSPSCDGIVQTSVTIGLDGPRTVSADLSNTAVAVDVAVNPSGTLLAVVAPGHWGSVPTGGQLRMYSLTGTSPLNPLAPEVPLSAFPASSSLLESGRPAPMRSLPCLAQQTALPNPDGQATAVAFLREGELAVFDREPAAITFIDVATRRASARIDLGQETRYDTGHALFHMRSSGGIACASCHAEAGDDGHVWTFENIGPRRTQTLRGGILGTEPLHWNGDMKDFGQLVDDVFVQRMSGGMLSLDHKNALAHWIDRQPALAASAHDNEQAQRGQQLFESEAVGCTQCHTGPHLTNNTFADVGTGANLQVPILRGVSFRLPLMHDGCAATLRQRFDAACGGGELHGHTAQLSTEQLDDLVAYLETL